MPTNWQGWPEGRKYALVLTHDVETGSGIANIHNLTEIESRHGFRSSFNIVGNDYNVPNNLLQDLNRQGYEVGVHGLHHNGLMYISRRTFRRHAAGIRHRMMEWNTRGFRSPSMHRELEWIHELGVEYDSSTFDTDPFEPQPDGVGTIFPFWVVNKERNSAFVELPYTLPQDMTLFGILRERTIDIWKQKLDWIAEHGGMALVITHPDYMDFEGNELHGDKYPARFYQEFLEYIQTKYEGQYWAALPSEVAKYFASIYPKPISSDRRPLRVCMSTYSYYETDTRVRRYAETLARRGDEVDVVSLRRSGQCSKETINGVNVYRIQERIKNETGALSYLWRTNQFLLKSTAKIFCLGRHGRYDLIHVHNIPDSQVFSALTEKLRGARVILDIHDIVPELFCSKFFKNANSLYFWAIQAVERISAKFADHVIVANDLWGEKIASRSVPRNKCTVLLNYPDPCLFHSSNGNRRTDSERVIIYPGSLNHHQGLDIAVDAFHKISAELPDARFLIYGDGPAKKSLFQQAKKVRLDGRIQLLDPLPLEEISSVMAKATCGIVSKRADGFGNEAFSTKILEFMALGVPVLVSDTTIDRYYFDDSLVLFFESGNPFDLAAKMKKMLTDENLRNQLVEKSRRFIEQNNWDVKKQVYLQLVDKLVRKESTVN